MLTHHAIAMVFVKEATKTSSMAMLGRIPMDQAIFEYRTLMDTLEKQPNEVKLNFAWAVQERTRLAIDIYNRMGPKAEMAAIALLPKNMTMTVMCYNTVADILGDKASPIIKHLKDAFNKLPTVAPDNPAKQFYIYKNAKNKL